MVAWVELSLPPGVLVSRSRVCLLPAARDLLESRPLTLSYSEVLLVAAVTLSLAAVARPSAASLTRDVARGRVDDPVTE